MKKVKLIGMVFETYTLGNEVEFDSLDTTKGFTYNKVTKKFSDVQGLTDEQIKAIDIVFNELN